MTAQNLIINSLEFARKSHAIHDTIAPSQLGRVKEKLASQAGGLDFSLIGEALSDGEAALNFELKGTLAVACQRCLEPIELNLDIRSKFFLVRDESKIPVEDVDDDDKDYLVADEAFDVLQLVEDEVLLAMPFAPMHSPGDCPASDMVSELKTPSPFAGLKILKQ